MKLHYKLYLFFAGVVVFPLIVVTIAVSLVLFRSGTEAYESRIRSGLAAGSAIISGEAQVLSKDFQTALTTADTAALTSGDYFRIIAAMETLRGNANASAAVITSPDGNIIAAAGESAEGEPLLASSTQLNRFGETSMKITVFRPFDQERLQSIFSSLDLDWGLLNGDTVESGSLPPGQKLPTATDAASRGSGNDELFKADSDSMDILASAVPVPRNQTNTETVLVAAVQNDIVSAASRQALEVGLGLMVLVAALAASLGYLLTRAITSPIRELNRAAAAGIEGNLEQRVRVRSRDELGSLADSFNQMQENLKTHITDLEESRNQLLLALSYAGDILESTTDRTRLVKSTAEAVWLTTDVRAIWVELFESREPPVHSGVSYGAPSGVFQGEYAMAAKDLVKDLVAGGVSAGEPVKSGDRRMIAFPLTHDKKMLGAMVAVYEHNQIMGESQSKILGSLAAQAGSALENVNYGDLQQLLTITDPMTGLYNFRYLNNAIDSELSKSRRYGHQLALAIIDLDDFKGVNDTYGHAAGDALLKAVAETLLGTVREADTVARYGGEEFVVIFSETSKQAANGAGEKLRLAVAAIRLEEYPDIRITASIGIAGYPDDAGDKKALLAKVDQALYHAKGEGKNQVVVA